MWITLLDVLYKICLLRDSYCFVVWLLGAGGQRGICVVLGIQELFQMELPGAPKENHWKLPMA